MRGKRLNSTTILICTTALFLIPNFASADMRYKVKSGDTLWALAKKHQISVKSLAKANGLCEEAKLALGKTLIIPTKASSAVYTPKEQASEQVCRLVHTTVDNACLRTGPSTNYNKIAVLEQGLTAKVIGEKGDWTKVAFSDGTCGYIYNSLLEDGIGQVAFSDSVPKAQPELADQNSDKDESLIHTALALRGSRYRRGGTSRGGFDCSGFTRYVFAKYGVSLPHSSAAQSRLGASVSRNELKSGDLVFFQTTRRGISHVGIYIGDGKFVHAARYGKGVRTDTLTSGYYSQRYRGARRVK